MEIIYPVFATGLEQDDRQCGDGSDIRPHHPKTNLNILAIVRLFSQLRRFLWGGQDLLYGQTTFLCLREHQGSWQGLQLESRHVKDQ